jgi:hypothetical protein
MKEIIASVLAQRPSPFDLNKRRAIAGIYGAAALPLAKMLVVAPGKEAEQTDLLAAAFATATDAQKAATVKEIPAFEACFAAASTPAATEEKKTRTRSTTAKTETAAVGTEGGEARLEQIEKQNKVLQEGLSLANDKLDAANAKLEMLEVFLITIAGSMGIELPASGG